MQSSYDTPDAQTAALETLEAELTTGRDGLVEAWGQPMFDMVSEMVEIELGSVPVRATWDDNPGKSAHLREQLMKQLADARLAGYEYGSVVNVGGNHAQKERLKGTDQEWLGDWLVHTSTAPDGSGISDGPVVEMGDQQATEPPPGAEEAWFAQFAAYEQWLSANHPDVYGQAFREPCRTGTPDAMWFTSTAIGAQRALITQWAQTP